MTGTLKTPEQIAQRAVDIYSEKFREEIGAKPLLIPVEAVVTLARGAIEADRAQRDNEEASLAEKVHTYAEDRARHALSRTLNTVGSGRIASDLFQMLGLPYPDAGDL